VNNLFKNQPRDPNSGTTPSTRGIPKGSTIVIVIVVIVAAILILPRLLGGGDATVAPLNPNDGGTTFTDDGIQLGQIVASRAVDRDGCPTSTTNNFQSGDSIYVVAPGSAVSAGTSVFARLYYENQPVEDARAIDANEAYSNTCINFVFEPLNGAFQRGSYEAEFFVNGNAAGSTQFNIN